MSKIKTVQGDTWDIISKRQYGTEKRIAELIEANPAHRLVTIFPANVVIEVPVIDQAAVAVSPPWRRANG